jgi:hypothetical protein
MVDVREKFGYSNDVELEISDPISHNLGVEDNTYILTQSLKGIARSSHVQNNSLGVDDRHLLLSAAHDTETFPLLYPSILFDLPEGYDSSDRLTTEEIELIQGAGLNNVDDVTFLSPLNLCLIAPKKIVELYCWVGDMIARVHKEKMDSIEEVKGWRQLSSY